MYQSLKKRKKKISRSARSIQRKISADKQNINSSEDHRAIYLSLTNCGESEKRPKFSPSPWRVFVAWFRSFLYATVRSEKIIHQTVNEKCPEKWRKFAKLSTSSNCRKLPHSNYGWFPWKENICSWQTIVRMKS